MNLLAATFILAFATSTHYGFPTSKAPPVARDLILDAENRVRSSLGRDTRDERNRVVAINSVRMLVATPAALKACGFTAIGGLGGATLVMIRFQDGIGLHRHTFAYSPYTHFLVAESDIVESVSVR